jgi:hypothetical protein
MYRNGGAGYAEFIGNFLLLDHRICFNKLENLPFPLCHGNASFFKTKFSK